MLVEQGYSVKGNIIPSNNIKEALTLTNPDAGDLSAKIKLMAPFLTLYAKFLMRNVARLFYFHPMENPTASIQPLQQGSMPMLS